jgi:hypothetical protein
MVKSKRNFRNNKTTKFKKHGGKSKKYRKSKFKKMYKGGAFPPQFNELRNVVITPFNSQWMNGMCDYISGRRNELTDPANFEQRLHVWMEVRSILPNNPNYTLLQNMYNQYCALHPVIPDDPADALAGQVANMQVDDPMRDD